MSRRNREAAAERAAMEASEAGRVLQAQRELPGTRDEPSKSEGGGEKSKQEGGQRPPPRNEPRRLAMEEIYDKDLKRKDFKFEPSAEEPAKEPEKKAEEAPQAVDKKEETSQAKSAEATAQPLGAAIPPATVVAPQQTTETVRVKVDGEEFEVPKADVDAAGGLAAYQRDRASENRLKKANEALAEAKRTQAAIAEWAKSQMPKEATQTDDQFIASQMDIIRFGTPEEGAAAMQKILQRAQPKHPEPAHLVEMATAKMRHDQAVQDFDKEFQDVTANPLAVKLVVALRNERIAQAQQGGKPIDNWNTFYRTIGNEVRSLIAPRQSQAQQQPPAAQAAAASTTADSTSPGMSEKEARKASIVNLPTAAAARAELPKEDKPETRDEILNSMRKARGIPTG